MKKIYNAAVVGLGNVGFQFDLDAKRTFTWSHISAYEKCKATRIAGAVEVDEAKVRIFKKHKKNIPVFRSVKELLSARDVDIISICTPTEYHYPIFKDAVNSDIKAIFCEKPFVSDIADGRDMIKECARRKKVLAVNHLRRWDGHYTQAAKLVQAGRIGDIKAVTAFYPGHVYNMGTHLFDFLRMALGRDPEVVSGLSFDPGAKDPHISGWIAFEGGVPCSFAATGKRENLIVAVEIVGDKGAVRISEHHGEVVELFHFSRSRRYAGYCELSPVKVPYAAKMDRFVEAVYDIVDVVEGKRPEPCCSGKDGLAAFIMSRSLAESARNGGDPVKLVGKYAL